MDQGENAGESLFHNKEKNSKLEIDGNQQGEPDNAKQASSGEEITPTLTKSQMKKLKKKERWEQVKHQKRKAEKQRYKARKKACIERGEEVGPSRKQLKHNRMSKSTCKVRVVVDCDFDQYMADKDIRMLVKQIQFSYSANRRAENPMQFYCCGISGKTNERLQSLGDYKGWDINFHSERFLDMFDKASVVYLSSESPNILETLCEDKVYIIGGLVDHNHQKGLCHRLAVEKGIAHAQLPISEYIDMKTRKVLTINHVFEILLNYTETKDWQKSFYKVLPPRKGAILKVDMSSEKQESDDCAKGNNSNSSCSDKGDNIDSDSGDLSTEHAERKNPSESVNQENNSIDLGHEQNQESENSATEIVTVSNNRDITSGNESSGKDTERT